MTDQYNPNPCDERHANKRELPPTPAFKALMKALSNWAPFASHVHESSVQGKLLAVYRDYLATEPVDPSELENGDKFIFEVGAAPATLRILELGEGVEAPVFETSTGNLRRFEPGEKVYRVVGDEK